VRLRRDGTGFATLGTKKVQALKRAAAQFRREWEDEDRDFRFDLVTFDGAEFEHFPDFVHFD
jgi:Holliday junction resolvase-like predicted endonuclease